MDALEPEEGIPKGTHDWPHAPPHRMEEAGVYFVTARARNQCDLLSADELKDWFQATLFQLVEEFGWELEAWAILSNHYHLIAHSLPRSGGGASSLSAMVKKLHSLATKELNRRDGMAGRTRLWQNFRETQLTHHESYMARLNYVHQNAVHHGLVRKASEWKWCSAGEFKKAVSSAWLRTVAGYRFDEIARQDGE